MQALNAMPWPIRMAIMQLETETLTVETTHDKTYKKNNEIKNKTFA